MSQSTTGTAAPSPAASIRGDPDSTTAPWNHRRPRREARSASAGGFTIPEGMVLVWDETMRQMVVKDRDDVKLKTWKTRLRRAAFKFWAGGPPSAQAPAAPPPPVLDDAVRDLSASTGENIVLLRRLREAVPGGRVHSTVCGGRAIYAVGGWVRFGVPAGAGDPSAAVRVGVTGRGSRSSAGPGLFNSSRPRPASTRPGLPEPFALLAAAAAEEEEEEEEEVRGWTSMAAEPPDAEEWTRRGKDPPVSASWLTLTKLTPLDTPTSAQAVSEDTSMSQPSIGGTAAPTPAASVRGDTATTADTTAASSAGTASGLVVPEGKTWTTRLRDAVWKFWAGGPAGA
eukprot:g9755.t3